MVSLQFMERLAARFLLKVKIAELHGNAFQSFFQDLMCLRYPADFVDVRTAGQLGDRASDGLLLHGRKLYACYAPETFNARKIERKFADDLANAKRKRSDEFDTFVFVHNDVRGMHPIVSSLISQATTTHNPLRFEQFGYRRIRDEAMNLTRQELEDLLGTPLPIQELVYGVGLEEMAPLLDYLSETRKKVDSPVALEPPSNRKLNYNIIDYDTRRELAQTFAQSVDIDSYYSSRYDVTERDEVAQSFHEEYLRVRSETSDPKRYFGTLSSIFWAMPYNH